MRETPGEVTLLLSELNLGNKDALNRLIPLVYGELRRIAAHYLRGGEDWPHPQTDRRRSRGVSAAHRPESCRLAGSQAVHGGGWSADAADSCGLRAGTPDHLYLMTIDLKGNIWSLNVGS